MLSDFAYGQIIKKKLVIMLFVFIPLENGTDPKDNKKIGTKKTDVSLALLFFLLFLKSRLMDVLVSMASNVSPLQMSESLAQTCV